MSSFEMSHKVNQCLLAMTSVKNAASPSGVKLRGCCLISRVNLVSLLALNG